MDIQVKIKNINRTSEIDWKNFAIRDNVDDEIDTCSFTIDKYKTEIVIPQVGEEVLVYDGAEKIFAGTILTVHRRLKQAKHESISVEAADYTHNLGRSIIVEKFEDRTVNYIINELLNCYHVEFSDEYVDCSLEIKTIIFDNISVLEAIQRLSEATNYRWYVDYDKKVHFFEKSTNSAPFNPTDTNGKYIFTSLELTDDISQLRNSVKIRGGDTESEARTEKFDGDGEKLTFALANRFSKLPTVTVGAPPPEEVGIDYLSKEADFDCFWNFNEKYIRFKVAPPVGTNNIVVAGIPLIPIIVKKVDSGSVNQYGLFEFYRREGTIKSREEAVQYATAQLEAYKNSIIEGSFETYEPGLKSGQIINIQSDVRDIDENFLIQKVRFKMRSPQDGFYKVELATMRTIGIIDFLQELLKIEKRIILKEQEQEPLLTYHALADSFGMADAIGTPSSNPTQDYVWVDNGEPNPIIWNMWTWAPTI